MPTMMEIRAPAAHEQEAWLALWQGYLVFYESTLPGAMSELTWQRFHDPAEPMHVVAAYEGGAMVGFATYILHRSTWARHHYCYLEDLFVDESQRGKGVARALIAAVRAAAREKSCERLYWQTREGNKTAQALYDRLAEKTDFIQYRMRLD
jgi:GNAT superfamily N-acetyltransferase